MSTIDRWVIRNVSQSSTASDPRTADVVVLLRRTADHLEVLGSAYVNGMSLERDWTSDGVVRLSVFFDPDQMKVAAYWLDPRGAAAYGTWDSLSDDKLFMVKLADHLDARTVVDLGCGTGTLARELASAGRRVIGVDPSKAMIDVARSKDGSERVQWVEGHASDVGTPDADLLVMTGNVAQCFDDDAEWDAALRAIRAALRPGGYLAFGSRNPDAREWERWPETEGNVEILAVEEGRVLTQWTDCFADPDEILDGSGWFRFRSLGEFSASLVRAGLAVEHAYGDWDGSSLSDVSPNIVIVAKTEDELSSRG